MWQSEDGCAGQTAGGCAGQRPEAGGCAGQTAPSLASRGGLWVKRALMSITGRCQGSEAARLGVWAAAVDWGGSHGAATGQLCDHAPAACLPACKHLVLWTS